MRIHQEEIMLARAFSLVGIFEGLTKEQKLLIRQRTRNLHEWFKAHRVLHSVISTAVLAFIFSADLYVLLYLPRSFVAPGGTGSFREALLGSFIVGSLHSWLMYSLVAYSVHEGASHNAIFPPRDPISRGLDWISGNLCRLGAADPEFYARNHRLHHEKFGTEQDGEFLNFVFTRRYLLTFLPFATVFNYGDFISHRPGHYTRSRTITALAALIYNGTFAWHAWKSYGATFALLTFLVFLPHVGFYLDRMRQFCEHNMMPVDSQNGARSLGIGFWGLLVGGGPWGQPCHLAHHLATALPWYQQIALHRFLKRILSPAQRKQFMIAPVIGFPLLWWRLVTKPAKESGYSPAQWLAK